MCGVCVYEREYVSEQQGFFPSHPN
jgi:hypothetical protein